METLQFIYNEQPVDFEPTGKDSVMVNATQMAKIFNKRIDFFLKSEHANEFIKVLEFTPFGGNSAPLTRDEIIQSRGQNGTYMHRILALKFAAWLDPSFELWVYTTIDRVLNHYFREQRDAMIEKITIKAKKEAKRAELLAKFPEMAEYFDLEQQEKDAQRKTINASREQFRQLSFEFLPAVINEE
ncbi:MAG: KilA-N domain-containing protein [Bacteroidales bacterium]